MPTLIVNADDLGYTSGVNRAIFELAEQGALQSATLMARGAAFPEVAHRLQQHLSAVAPEVGCHVVLVDGVASASADQIPTLLSAPEGKRLRPTLGHFVRDLLLGHIGEGELEREIVAQIRTLQQAGCSVSHLDTHKHTHMFPRVLRPLLRAALLCGVRAIRNPFEPAWARAATVRAARRLPPARRLQTALLGSLRKQFLQEVGRAGLQTTDGALGVLATGVLDTPLLEHLLTTAESHPGTWELVCHPGYVDDALQHASTRLVQERERERLALLRCAAVAPGLKRISFAQLARG